MTAPVSPAESSSPRLALVLQQRMAAVQDLQRVAENKMQAKQLEGHTRLQQLETAEKAYREEMIQPVFVMELEDGTKFEVRRDGGVVGSGPRGALVLGLDDLARKAGFPEPKTQEEAMMQKIIVLQLHYGSEEVRNATRKFLDDAKKAIAVLSQMVQMLQEGWTSGLILRTPMRGTDGDDELKFWSPGHHIMAGAGNDLVYADRYSVIDAGDGDDTVMAAGMNTIDGGAGNDMISVRGKSYVGGGADHDTIKLWGRDGTAGGGSGDDVIETFGGSAAGGAGRDIIRSHGGTADGGEGDDAIFAVGDSVVTGGAGNDLITGHGGNTIDAGEGDDVVDARGGGTVAGGAGNDLIRASGGDVDGGAGDDVIENIGGTTNGGAGDDFIMGIGQLDGGDGNDAILGYGYKTTISGGRGDDQILAYDMTSIAYGRGDGRDTMASTGLVHVSQYGERTIRPSAVTFNLGQGLSRQDMQISVSGNDMKLDFGGGDSITIQDYRNMSATMVFADGSRMRVTDFVASGTPLTPAGRAVDLQA